ncbi:hypothetical protein VOLCADRAFT_59532 [Volvox carteri f. nagariensis]|uniref:VOC domain-containing protein n=1 Tax=Volvox carteri f. nagariensis TaxID=3068 RepID=D8TTH1_VOLCA|nr:uncharacterized protein VOLCADRAFT_59532 [Volvox carteri f. nagariensis]EFJ49306.1 hypothetical protein VOLCADRAFT_59532 [Volvox carteri f. nagariensis]|eukprot:XP_002949754.1 hypothetical protein VOLCADRAFT_59532 [Volvox carteri f. nagariensis]
MGPTPCRNLHWVFKVGDRTATIRFYEDVLLMKPLRHEEFTEGCAAACNGPYDGMWSKTMIGYGPEDDNFVLELTYNYGVKSYELGNDYMGITIRSKRVYGNIQVPCVEVAAPDGYRFWVQDEEPQLPGPSSSSPSSPPCPMTELRLHVTDLERSLAFWSGFLGFSSRRPAPGEALLSCGPGQCELRLVQLPQGQPLQRGTAFGRVAFACPGEQLQQLEADVRAAGYTVHTPYVSLDTPGKATVQVVILQDPDGHEICFVGDAGFRELSVWDPSASRLLAEALEKDRSAEWFKQREEREARMRAKGV